MKLFTKCRNCKNEISFKNSCTTRVQLAMQEDENIMLSCKECFIKDKYFVNDIYAKKSKLIKIISSLIFLVGTPLLGYKGFQLFNYSVVGAVRIGVLLLPPVFIYGFLKSKDKIRVNTFNRRDL